MTGWLPADLIIGLSAVLLALGVIWRYAIAPAVRTWRSAHERWEAIEKLTADVARQVTPNGGGTDRLGDRMVRTEKLAKESAQLAGEAATEAATAREGVDRWREEVRTWQAQHTADAAGRDGRIEAIEAFLAGQLYREHRDRRRAGDPPPE